MMKYLAFLLLWLFVSVSLKAVELNIRAQLDSSIILIGDQVKLQLEIEYPAGMELVFPIVLDSLGNTVEVVERFAPDTVKLDNERLRMAQEFLVTSFDTGHHVIPSFQFAFQYQGYRDTAYSNSPVLHVFTLPKLDSLMNALKGPIDIKPVAEAPVTFKEVAPWIMGILLAAGILFLIWYAIQQRKNNRSFFGFPPKPKEPAHLIALRELDRIKAEKIWQQGKTKEFYSDITEVLREYIENRFEINALELTSDETIAEFKHQKNLLDEVTFNNLVRILKNADLVKFAKYEPLPDDNNLTLVDAYFFVNQTKIEVIRETADLVDEAEGEDVMIK
ncbi:MAG: hypothetical protein JXR22_11335 [Prolixibacteraceae bacterium]|nr:hypothetical protein [Prolixibacteraceae bacterium]